MKKTVARYFLFGGLVVFFLTLIAFLGREFGWAPARKTPAFRRLGAAKSAIFIEEFTDFQCPACSRASGEVKKLVSDGASVSFKHRPLAMHRWALKAAIAAECAGYGGKFQPYADALFARQAEWSDSPDAPAFFNKLAAETGISGKDFSACLSAEKAKKSVWLDIAEAEGRRVDSVPAFFVNGRKAVGVSALLEEISREKK